MEHLYVLKGDFEEDSRHMQIYEDLRGLISMLEKDGLNYVTENEHPNMRDVIVCDLRIHINPYKLKRITDIVMQEDIKILGGLPNIHRKKDIFFSVYEWRAPKTKSDKEFSFAIYFQSKETNKLIYFLPIIFLILIIFIIFLRLLPY